MDSHDSMDNINERFSYVNSLEDCPFNSEYFFGGEYGIDNLMI